MILRYVVVLPCYNNPKTIEQVVLDTLEKTPFPILIVDDGSTIPVSELLQSAQAKNALQSKRLTILRHDNNRGKGVALKTAFQWALENDKTHVISMDSDGQHLADEVEKLVQESRQNPWSMIIGSRKFLENVPNVSKFGRKFSNFWVKYETDYNALDSQSGFRIYPLFYVQNLSLITRKYDFEIEILIRLLWAKVEVREVEIQVHYPPAHERVSHFDKWWDNVRLSLLNTILVVLSLLRASSSPWRMAVALGVGIFIGCTPFFGFHVFIAMATAVVFRLNFLWLFVGSNISVPWIAPFLVSGSATLGKFMLGADQPFYIRWFCGSLFLGMILGTIGTVAVYFIKKRFLKKKEAWTGKTRGGFLGNGFLKIMLRYFGLRTGYFFLYLIVPYFYIFAPRGRRALNQYWKQLSPDGWGRRQLHILQHFLTFGKVLMDRTYQSFHETLQFQVATEGPVNIYNVVESQKGWVFIGAHVGGWDLSTVFLQRNPQMARLGKVHFLADGFTFDKVIQGNSQEQLKVDSIRSESGFGENSAANSTMVVRDFLQNKKHVGFLADRAMSSQIELVHFMGKLAPFEVGPYRIAAACHAPMIFTYAFRVNTREYLFISSQHSGVAKSNEATSYMKYSTEEDRRLQIRRWAQEYADDLETKIRRFPYQWFNFYPFWSTLPRYGIDEKNNSSFHHLLEELHTPVAQVPGRESESTTSAGIE